MQSRTLCALVAALLVGCGGGGPKSDPDAIHDVLKHAAAGVADRNGQTVCGYLTQQAQVEVLQLLDAGDIGDCAGAVKLTAASLTPLDRQQIRDAEPQNIQVNGTTATAQVVEPSSTNQGRVVQLQLQKTTDGWLISAVAIPPA